MSGKNAYDGALFLNIEHKVSQTYPLALNTRRRRRGARAARRTNVFELNLACFMWHHFVRIILPSVLHVLENINNLPLLKIRLSKKPGWVASTLKLRLSSFLRLYHRTTFFCHLKAFNKFFISSEL